MVCGGHPSSLWRLLVEVTHRRHHPLFAASWATRMWTLGLLHRCDMGAKAVRLPQDLAQQPLPLRPPWPRRILGPPSAMVFVAVTIGRSGRC